MSNNDIGRDIYCEIEYQPKENNEEKVRIFGGIFIENNIGNCSIIYKNQEYELKEYFEDIDKAYNHKDIIKFYFRLINHITDMSYMFSGCNSLFKIYSFKSLSILPTSNVTNMSFMFSECNSLTSLPDIDTFNTSNVIDMSGIFYECSSLISLPNISKWNTSNVKYMGYMFSGCSSLKSLPDISNWNTLNIIYLNRFISFCSSLESLPDISIWNIPNTKNIFRMLFFKIIT